MADNDLVFGLEVDSPLPEGWTPLEAVVIVKCLDENGELDVHRTATSALNVWEAAGLVMDAHERFKNNFVAMAEEDDNEEDNPQ